MNDHSSQCGAANAVRPPPAVGCADTDKKAGDAHRLAVEHWTQQQLQQQVRTIAGSTL
jgi:hypothetical protein